MRITHSEHNGWEQYSDPTVRDIAWILTSPSVLNRESQTHVAAALPPFHTPVNPDLQQWLDELEANPNQLEEIQRSRYRRLGLYCEALVAFIGSHQRPFHSLALTAKNLQIHTQGRTLGELDFLFQRKQDEYAHLEMAVKYYLHTTQDQPGNTIEQNQHSALPPVFSGSENFVGPNRNDRLNLKLNRMISHQLPIIHSDEATSALTKAGVSPAVRITSHLLLIGKMFFNPFDTQSPLSPPTTDYRSYTTRQWCEKYQLRFLNHDQYTALWLHTSQFEHYASTYPYESKWLVLNKLDWLAGPKATHSTYEESHSTDRLLKKIQLEESKKQAGNPFQADFALPILLQRICPADGKGAGYEKNEQVMLVDDRWPQHF